MYYATREALGLAFRWSAPVAFLARFMTVYAAVIAVTKDLPDVEGDRKGGIDTLASRFGAGKVSAGASAVLGLNYVAAMATALLAPAGAFRRSLMVGGHALAAAWLLRSQRKLDASSKTSIVECAALPPRLSPATPLSRHAALPPRISISRHHRLLWRGSTSSSSSSFSLSSPLPLFGRYYQQIWNLFYYEYVLYCFI